MDASKVAVLIPYYGGYDPEHFMCVLALRSSWDGLKIYPIQTCPYIDLARSLLVAKAYSENPGLECVVFIDHDIIFEPRDVEKLVDELLARDDIDVLGAGYSMRQPGGKMIGSILPDATLGTDPTEDSAGIPFFQAPGARPFPALYTGFGFTAIKTKVFQALNETCPEMKCGWTMKVRPYFALCLDDNIYRGEDVSFCHRARKAGQRVWLDTRIRILHKGTYKYKLEDMGWVIPTVGELTINPTETHNPGMPMMSHDPIKVAAE